MELSSDQRAFLRFPSFLIISMVIYLILRSSSSVISKFHVQPAKLHQWHTPDINLISFRSSYPKLFELNDLKSTAPADPEINWGCAYLQHICFTNVYSCLMNCASTASFTRSETTILPASVTASHFKSKSLRLISPEISNPALVCP